MTGSLSAFFLLGKLVILLYFCILYVHIYISVSSILGAMKRRLVKEFLSLHLFTMSRAAKVGRAHIHTVTNNHTYSHTYPSHKNKHTRSEHKHTNKL